MTPKLRILLGVVFVAIPVDQLTKWLVVSRIPHGERIPLLEGFLYLTHARNPGAAFGLLSDAPPETRMIAFVAVSLIVLVLIMTFFYRLAPGERLTAFALALIFSGAIGNLADRIARGAVIDFMQFQLWRGYAWPDFNFADSFIIVGVSALIFDLLASEAISRARAENGPEV